MPVHAPLADAAPAVVGLVVVLDVLLVLVVARVAGRLVRRIGQPAVVGEIAAGLALGPSLLGLLHADLPGTLFPADARPALRVVALVGLSLFMFGVGRETDPARLRGSGRRIAALSGGSVVLPALAGALVAVPLYAGHDVVDGRSVPAAAFVAFVAVATTVTAFPVLARILDERGLVRAPVGTTAMAVAAVTDLAAWSALIVVVAVWGDGGRPLGAVLVLVVGLGLVLRLLAVPALRGVLTRRDGDATALRAALVLAGALVLVAGATEELGLHAAIGAFALGVLCPRGGAAGRAADAGGALLLRAGVLLVPVFFLTTGLSVDLAALGPDGVLEFGVLLVTASAAKFVGVAGAARLTGTTPRDAAALGVLMNARGLTEIVLLEVGRSAGIIDDTTFAALVGVALVTTVATGPLFRRLHGDDREPAVGRTLREEAAATGR